MIKADIKVTGMQQAIQMKVGQNALGNVLGNVLGETVLSRNKPGRNFPLKERNT